MIHEFKDVMVHPSFEDGVLTFSTYMTDACGPEECHALYMVGAELESDSPQEVGFDFQFSASSLLNDMLGLYTLHEQEAAIDAEDKPMFDALRSELLAMVGKIDALKVRGQ